MDNTYPDADFRTARCILLAAAKSRRNVLLLGSPGIGKTALLESAEFLALLAAETGIKRVTRTIIASQCDPIDSRGVIHLHDGVADMVPIGVLREACERPILLFLDELTTAPSSVFNSFLRMLSERVVGDTPLHPDTIIVAAGNPLHQVAGGGDMPCMVTGRFSPILNLVPAREEVISWFERYGDPGSALRAWAVDFAATLAVSPDLLQMDPPDASINGGASWGAPRAWANGLAVVAAMPVGAPEGVEYTILAGSVGKHGAASFLGIRKLRVHLPSVEMIDKDPGTALVPDNADYQIGALGLLAHVAEINSFAAWIYADRLRPEIGAAASSMLLRRPDCGPKGMATAGQRAKIKAVARVGSALRK